MHFSGCRRQDVRDTDCNHHKSGHLAVWITAPPTVQEIRIRSTPDGFFRPPYIGAKRWVGVLLDARTDRKELAGILHDGYVMSAPARIGPPSLAAQMARRLVLGGGCKH
jgi:hypothetical protein